ncbi:hypothetical protein PT974_11305 [Cladobotryum mycophilum]|uniref:Uncharacterized protein n=1 Tax=Cladobotryum mycophilum TaxID=491253 RepID=A0ABR0S5C3_9HYPO
MTSQNAQPKVGGTCNVWECQEPVVAAESCIKHRNLGNATFQDGSVPPSSGPIHTAKRTRRLKVRGTSSFRLEKPHASTDSNATSLSHASVIGSNRQTIEKLLNKADPPVASMTSQALPQPSRQPVRESSVLNASIPQNDRQDSLQNSVAASASTVSITAEHRVSQGYNSARTVVQSHQTLPRITDGLPLVPPPDLNLVNKGIFIPPEKPFHSVITDVNTSRPSQRIEKSHSQGHCGIIVEIPSKRLNGRGSFEDLESSLYSPRKTGKRAYLEASSHTQHSQENMNKNQSSFSNRTLENSTKSQDLMPSSISGEGDLRGVTKPVSHPLEPPATISTDLTDDVRIRHISEPYVRGSRQSSGTLATDSRGSPTRQSSENHTETNNEVSAALYTPEFFILPQSPRQQRPTLAPKRSSSKQSVPTRSTSHSMAPSTPRTDISIVQKVKLPSRLSVEERRKALILKFDSVAFDTMIYRQSSLEPPPGITVLANRQHRRHSSSAVTYEDERMYLPINPVIHRPHNRSDEWHKEKALEIQARPGRKYWFGRVAERERWLRVKEMEKERKIASAKGQRALRRDPQPWTYVRPIDFGDVPEDQLPEDVLQNPAWAKACVWHRETKTNSLRRQRAMQSIQQQVMDQFQNVMKDVENGSKKRRREAT